MFINHRNFKIVTKMKYKSLIGLLVLFAAMSLVSAALDLTASETSFIVEHGNSKTITLTLNNTDATNPITGIVVSNSTGFAGTFSLSPSSISTIANNTATPVSLSISVPQNFPAQSVSATITASGTLNGAAVTDSVQLTITVPENKSLSITNIGGLSSGTNSTTFRVKNTGNAALTGIVSASSITDSKGNQLNLTILPTTSFSLNPGNDTLFNLTAVNDPSFLIGTHSGTLTATSGGLVNATGSFSFTETFCDFSQRGSDLKITKIKDNTLDNVDEFEWKPNDNVALEVKIENSRESDIDGTLEYALFDTINNRFVDLDEEEIDFTVEEKKSETVVIKFKIQADLDVDIASVDFNFFVKAYEEGAESRQCVDSSDRLSNTVFQKVTLKKKNHNVIIEKSEIPVNTLCNEDIVIPVKLVNIGRNDEDKVKARLFNKELGINLEKEIDNLDESDSRTISFSFKVPKNIAEKTYTLELDTSFNYDNGVYKTESDQEFSTFLKVEGNCQATSAGAQVATITATLTSGAKAGSEAVIKTTIKNTLANQAAYTLFVSGYENFADSVDITPSTMTLTAGETREATIKLNLKDSASGENTFSIKAVAEGKSTEQSVVLSVSGDSFFKGLDFSGNKFIWIVIAVNIILIILIVVIATRRRE